VFAWPRTFVPFFGWSFWSIRVFSYLSDASQPLKATRCLHTHDTESSAMSTWASFPFPNLVQRVLLVKMMSSVFVEVREVWNILKVSSEMPSSLRRRVCCCCCCVCCCCCLPLSFNTTHATPPPVFFTRTPRVVYTFLAPHFKYLEYSQPRQSCVAAPTSS
jgi:hypothetical protein